MLMEKKDDGATDAVVPGLEVDDPEVKMLLSAPAALCCAPAAALRADCGLLPLRMLGPVICREGGS